MILITGGGGFIGLNLARELVDAGQNVLLVGLQAFDLPSFLAPFAGQRVQLLAGDSGEVEFLNRIIPEYQIESIVHAAVVTESSPGSSLHQALKANLQGTAEILEAARRFHLRRVTFLSSISVYLPYREAHQYLAEENDLPAASAEWIGGTKKAGEQICQLYAHQYGISVPMLRPSQVWGPLYWTGRSPIMAMFKNSLEGTATDLSHIYGKARSSYIYVRDCARAISLVHLAPTLAHSIYNIADGQTHSLDDFARALNEVLPGTRIRLGQVKPQDYLELPPMSVQRIKEELDFEPRYSLDRALRSYLAWLKSGEYI